jgi:hypothetical protein
MKRRLGRHVLISFFALFVGAGLGLSVPTPAQATSPFTDIAGTTFEQDIDWLWEQGITVGCTPTRFCPDDAVTRGQMAAFLVRMFELTAGASVDAFTDDESSIYERDINRLAYAAITKGCAATTFCPKAPVRRDEMASFIARAIPLSAGAGDNYFRDDDGTTHEANIDRAAAGGIASGCGTWRFCPGGHVTRGQVAGFLHRVVGPIAPPPPAPIGPAIFYVATSGEDGDNYCLVETSPCRTIGRALTLAYDDDTIEIGPGTFVESGLRVSYDMTINGDDAGGTTIDAGGAGRSIFSIGQSYDAGSDTHVRRITLARLTLTGSTWGGAVSNGLDILTITGSTIRGNIGFLGGGVSNIGTLTIVDSTITGNTAVSDGPHSGGNGGAIYGWSSSRTTVVGSTISGNAAGWGGGGIYTDGLLTVVNSTISGNTAAGGGGGIANNNFNDWYPGSTLTIVNSTISGNTAAGGGGGIANDGRLHLKNAIVAGNTDPDSPEISGTIESKLASIVGVAAGLTLADILVPGGLKDNGGPTQTIALVNVAKNPAKGKGSAATCASAPVSGLDQRGLPRTSPCDIGAYELQP